MYRIYVVAVCYVVFPLRLFWYADRGLLLSTKILGRVLMRFKVTTTFHSFMQYIECLFYARQWPSFGSIHTNAYYQWKTNWTDSMHSATKRFACVLPVYEIGGRLCDVAWIFGHRTTGPIQTHTQIIVIYHNFLPQTL